MNKPDKWARWWLDVRARARLLGFAALGGRLLLLTERRERLRTAVQAMAGCWYCLPEVGPWATREDDQAAARATMEATIGHIDTEIECLRAVLVEKERALVVSAGQRRREAL